MTVLLDSHVLHWWSSDSRLLSAPAARAIARADELAVASITWYELAWLVEHDRIRVPMATRTWLDGLAEQVRTVGTTPAIAATAAALPPPFPNDPADRIIYATAIEHGWPLVTRDGRLREHKYRRKITVW